MKHLQAIHKHLFSDLYDWAGKIRDVDIAKSRMFCRSVFIPDMADDIFGKLKKDSFLKNLPQDKFIDKLSYYMGEVNALHPFREGNGRTQRNFFTQLSEQAGYSLDFTKTDKGRLLQADISAMDGHYEELKSILSDICTPIPERQIEKKSGRTSVLGKLKANKEKITEQSKKMTVQKSKDDISL